MTSRDIARDTVRKRGALYFSDVLDSITEQLPAVAYSAVAASCAERLLTRHLQLPISSRRPFTVSCRYPLECMWGVLASQPDSASLREEVERWLQNFYNSSLNHNDGQDGPDDADDDPAAAFIYAAESLIKQSSRSAGYAMSRVIDDAFRRAEESDEAIKASISGVDDLIADCCHSIVQQELHWLQNIFGYVQSHSLSYETVTELRHRANA